MDLYEGDTLVWALVRGPVRRASGLAEVVVNVHGQTKRARDRGYAMTELAATLAASGASAHVEANEPDGARWSMTIAATASDHVDVRG